MKTIIRYSVLGLLMTAMAAPASTAPQEKQRTRDASAQRSQATPTRKQNAPRQDGARAQERTGSKQAATRKPRGNPHIPNKRVYFQRLEQEVGIHRTRMARLNQLNNIYTGKKQRSKMAEVNQLRNRESQRYQQLLTRFRDALGEEEYAAAAASLRIRSRAGAPLVVSRQTNYQQVTNGLSLRSRGKGKTISVKGAMDH